MKEKGSEKMNHFWHNAQQGAEAIEYAVILALVAIPLYMGVETLTKILKIYVKVIALMISLPFP